MSQQNMTVLLAFSVIFHLVDSSDWSGGLEVAHCCSFHRILTALPAWGFLNFSPLPVLIGKLIYSLFHVTAACTPREQGFDK